VSDEIDLKNLSDRDLLILCVQGINTHAKRLDSHAAKIRTLELGGKWLAGLGAGLGAIWAKTALKISFGQTP
jgi:hypothetical protein